MDARTGTPLLNVRILAAWKLDAMSFGGTSAGGTIRLQELVTNADGGYRFPLWFELHRPLVPFSWYTRRDMDFPQLLFFKAGYLPRERGNAWLATPGGRSSYTFLSFSWSSVDGEVIALQPAPDRADADAFANYVEQFNAFESLVEFIALGQHGPGCNWSERAGMLRELDSAADDLGFDSLLDDNRVPIERCNEAEAFQ